MLILRDTKYCGAYNKNRHPCVLLDAHWLSLGIRGGGVLPKGQHSWNISAMKEARMDPKLVLELSMECPSWGSFFCP